MKTTKKVVSMLVALTMILSVSLFAMPAYGQETEGSGSAVTQEDPEQQTGATLEVGAEKTYTTIAAALTEAKDGDTISIVDGEYKEDITLDKAVTLTMAEEAKLTGGIITVAKAGVVLDKVNFEYKGYDTPYGNLIIRADNVTVKESTFVAEYENNPDNDGNRITGNEFGLVQVNGNKEVVFENCTFKTNVMGIFPTQTSGSITGCSFLPLDGENARKAVAINNCGQNMSEVSIVNNTFEGRRILTSTAIKEVTGNKFLNFNSSVFVSGFLADGVTINAAKNYYGENPNFDVLFPNDEVVYSPYYADEDMTEDSLTETGKAYIETEGVRTYYASLQAAIAAATEGATVYVMPGNHDIVPDNETQVEGQAGWYLPITKSISLVGVDAAGKVITDAAQTVANIYSTTYTANGSWATQNLITIFADNVTLQGLTIMNKVETNKAIEVKADNFTVKYCRFAPIAENLLPEGGITDGEEVVYTYADNKENGGVLYFGGNTKDSVVENNLFVNAGIAFDSTDASTITITDNTFEGKRVVTVTEENEEGQPVKTSQEKNTINYVSWNDPQVVDITGSTIKVNDNVFKNAGKVDFSLVTAGSADFTDNYWGENPNLDEIIVVNEENEDGGIDAVPYYADEEKTESVEANVESLSISPESKSLYLGDSFNVSVTITPTAAQGHKVTYTSSNSSIASVSASGRVKGEGVGSAVITAKAGGKEVECRVTVRRRDTNSGNNNSGSNSGRGTGTGNIVISGNTSASSFNDVSTSDWYYDSVNQAVREGLFQGVTVNTFEPNGQMTRGMLVTVLWRMENKPVAIATGRFEDVPTNSWYATAVEWAAKNGIVNGMSETTFAPDQAITREQLATMITRYTNYKGIALSEVQEAQTFADDAQISDWAKDSVATMQKAGIIAGRGNGIFDPKGTATRAECAKILVMLP